MILTWDIIRPRVSHLVPFQVECSAWWADSSVGNAARTIEAGLLSLSELPACTRINLDDTVISDAAILRFREANPGTQVVRHWPRQPFQHTMPPFQKRSAIAGPPRGDG